MMKMQNHETTQILKWIKSQGVKERFVDVKVASSIVWGFVLKHTQNKHFVILKGNMEEVLASINYFSAPQLVSTFQTLKLISKLLICTDLTQPFHRFLSHSELAPLRVPLVPMEHCTSHFFQECDADKDKQVSFKEWTSCFGIKNGEGCSMSAACVVNTYSKHISMWIINMRLWLSYQPNVSNVTTTVKLS